MVYCAPHPRPTVSSTEIGLSTFRYFQKKKKLTSAKFQATLKITITYKGNIFNFFIFMGISNEINRLFWDLWFLFINCLTVQCTVKK